MQKIIKHAPNVIVTIFIIVTVAICLFGFTSIITNEHNLSLFKDSESIDIYEDKSKIEERKPQSYAFTLPIFMYHFIDEDTKGAYDSENYLSPEKLESHLKYISDNGFQSIFITELEKIYEYSKPVALTFDDCYPNFYYNAFPLLKKYNIKANAYIIVDGIDSNGYLTTKQVEEMRDSGLIEIGSHTASHLKLTEITKEKMIYEIVESKNKLKEKFNIDSKVLCYPYGLRNEEVLSLTKENYKYALDMLGGIYYSNENSSYTIPRIYANRSISIKTFANYLNKSKVTVNW